MSGNEESATDNLANKYECDICGQIFSKRSLIINHFITSLCYPSCSYYPKNDSSIYSLYKYSDNSKYCNKNMKEIRYNRMCSLEDETTKSIRNGKLSRNKKNYSCFNYDKCNKSFIGINTFKTHESNYAKFTVPNKSTTQDLTQNYKCSKCSEVFHMRSEIIVHIFSEHQEDYLKHSCDTCSRLYHSQEIILRLNINRFKCAICPKSFSTSYRLALHHSWHIGTNIYECQHCPKKFSNFSNYLFHERIHTEEIPFRCNFCGKWFPASCNLNIHFAINNKPFECNVCLKVFAKMSLLKSHKIIHSAEEKQLKDTNHNNLTVQSTSLEVQTKRHTFRELYHCKACNKSFLRLSLLRSHLKTHLDKDFQQDNDSSQNVAKLSSSQDQRACFTKDSFFKCDLCHEILSGRQLYINHRCTYCKCKCCPKVLSNTFSLKRHYWKVHKIHKPFECSLCKKSFQQTVSLYRHKQHHSLFEKKEILEQNNVNNYETNMAKKNGIKEYECDLCTKTFHSQYQICSHILETHY